MTITTSIITDAYRESNLIPLVATPNSNQQTEALNRLNPIILAAVGWDAGQPLSDLNIGGSYDETSLTTFAVPANARLVLNLSAATTLTLHPEPYEGMRLAFADAGNNLATYNLTLDGNGRTIEGSATLTLSTSGDSRQWLYRADTANWVKISALAIGDTMPFPQEFDDYFVTKLAMRLNPRYGQSLSAETTTSMRQAEVQLKARYRKPRAAQDTGTYGLIGQSIAAFGLSPSDFNAGRTWRW